MARAPHRRSPTTEGAQNGGGRTVTTSPEGKSTRAISRIYDAFGHLVDEVVPVDASQTSENVYIFDNAGRLATRVLYGVLSGTRSADQLSHLRLRQSQPRAQ